MKKVIKHIEKTPWDSKVFGLDTYEIRRLSKASLEGALKLKGHFTVKVDPLSSKKLLHAYGFYYCDTLIIPYCTPGRFRYFEHEDVSVMTDIDIAGLSAMSDYAFFHGRFHRDFNIDKHRADLRYAGWLKDLHKSGGVFALTLKGDVAGFFAFSENKILLHAINKKYKGKGLSKHLWSVACGELFGRGYDELTSSISASNAPAINLYCSLGFRFRDPLDVYHRYIE